MSGYMYVLIDETAAQGRTVIATGSTRHDLLATAMRMEMIATPMLPDGLVIEKRPDTRKHDPMTVTFEGDAKDFDTAKAAALDFIAEVPLGWKITRVVVDTDNLIHGAFLITVRVDIADE